MNIFYLHPDPITAARWTINNHTSKMVTETAQLLSSTYTVDQLKKAPPNQQGNPRKHSYSRHPCTLWTKRSLTNAVWLIQHGLALNEEKKRRFNSGDHFSVEFIRWCRDNPPDIPDLGFTTPALAMKQYPQVMDESDPCGSYRRFYVLDKRYDKSGKWMAYYPSMEDVPLFWREHWGLVADEEGPFKYERFIKV